MIAVRKMKVSAAVGVAFVAVILVFAAVHKQAQATAEQAGSNRHKVVACANLANGFECEKIRLVIAK